MQKAIQNHDLATAHDIVTHYIGSTIWHHDMLSKWLMHAVICQSAEIVKYFLRLESIRPRLKIDYDHLLADSYNFLLADQEILQQMLLSDDCNASKVDDWFRIACHNGIISAVQILARKIDPASVFELAVASDPTIEILDLVVCQLIVKPDMRAYQAAAEKAAIMDHVSMLKYLQNLGAKITTEVINAALDDSDGVLSYLADAGYIDMGEYQQNILYAGIHYDNAAMVALALRYGSVNDCNNLIARVIERDECDIYVVIAEYLAADTVAWHRFVRQVFHHEISRECRHVLCEILAQTRVAFQPEISDIKSISRWCSRKIWALIVTRMTDLQFCRKFIRSVLVIKTRHTCKIKAYLQTYQRLISGQGLRSIAANQYWQHNTKPDWHLLPDNVQHWLLAAAMDDTETLLNV